MKLNKMLSASLLGASLVALASSAQAATSWSFGSSGANNGSASAYAATNNSGGSATGSLATTTMTSWGGGLGAGGEGSSPHHGVDNRGSTEGILLNLGGSYSLTEFSVGYSRNKTNTSTMSPTYANGADVSVFAYVGTNAAPTLAGNTFAQLLNPLNVTNGWVLIGNYGNVGSAGVDGAGTQAISTTVSSSYWLVAAYNSVFGGTCSGCTALGSGYQGTDYFKLSGVAGNQPGGGGGGNAPEPSTMALLGISMLGAVALRRRQNPAAV
ncbi:MAG: PEP-CTERM sorting domain-containing protein [Betaproteobacteria bacterium]|nr:PEP-CTERM sorting domain-containing protein [Betaproteobacteria bacterium]